MAKVKFSDAVTDMRGKVGGNVYSRNHYGAFKRIKVTPVNPSTSRQQVVRAFLGTRSAAWRGLTSAQQEGWRNAATNFPRTNVFGDTIQLTGSSLYVSLNQNLSNAGQANISDAPVPAAQPDYAVTAVTVDDSDNTSTVTASGAVPTGHTLMVMATTQMSAGRNFFKGRYRLISTVAAATASGFDINAAYVAKFGAPTAGNKIGYYFFLVNNTTGQAFVGNYVSTVVVA